MLLTANFHFNGQGGEAIELYKRAFGAKVNALLRYSDADPGDFSQALTEAQKRRVYHAELSIGGQRIMLSDSLGDGRPGGAALSLVVTFDDAEQVRTAYAAMSEGCTIVHPLCSTTYSSCFVSLIDRFGFRWELMTEQTER